MVLPAIVLHVEDEPVTEAQGLVLGVLVLGAPDPPAKRNDDASLCDRHHLRIRVRDLDAGLEAVTRDSSAKDLTGLLGTMSIRSRPPPKVSPLDAPPFEVRGEERHERLDIAADRRVEGQLDMLSIDSAHGTLPGFGRQQSSR